MKSVLLTVLEKLSWIFLPVNWSSVLTILLSRGFSVNSLMVFAVHVTCFASKTVPIIFNGTKVD